MGAVSLVAGLAIGYLLHGSLSSAPVPQSAARSAASATPVSAIARRMPTLADMKQAADKQAAPVIEKLKADPNNSALLTQVGGIYHSNHQFKEAAAWYGKAAQADPKNVAIRTKLASSLYRNGEIDGAISQLNQALSYEPANADALFDLGMIKLQGKNDGKGAVAAWEKLLKMNPQLSADRKAQVQRLMADVLTSLGKQARQPGSANP